MSRKTVLWTLLVAGLAAGLFLVLSPARPIATCSTYSSGRKGCKAAFLFLRASGVPAFRRETSWRRALPARGLLVVAEPGYQPTPGERAALRRWVGRGGTILAAANAPWRLWPLGGSQVRGSSLPASFPPLVPTGLMAGVDSLLLTAAWRQRGPFPQLEAKARPPVILAGDHRGAAVLLASYGRGRVILVADRLFLANDRLKSAAGNALFLLNLCRAFAAERVEFDEYHLGYGYRPETAGTVAARLPAIVDAVWWQLLFSAGLYLFTVGRRFGRPKTRPETGGRTIAEYITSLAVLYQRADAGAIALAHLHHGLLERMRLLTGLSATAGADVLAAAAAKRMRVEPRDLQALLVRCEAALRKGEEATAVPGRMRPAELLATARRIDYYRKELERWATLVR